MNHFLEHLLVCSLREVSNLNNKALQLDGKINKLEVIKLEGQSKGMQMPFEFAKGES